ncbi:hypothetical protein B0J18DRAFT_420430 [Chaetomium sp. MPI-SDFR-AT-0129]|nr:hypothetical protein B0J18DRAFT_420430 [Chaetomium sp. MPI-SDFR-AT-0129]
MLFIAFFLFLFSFLLGFYTYGVPHRPFASIKYTAVEYPAGGRIRARSRDDTTRDESNRKWKKFPLNGCWYLSYRVRGGGEGGILGGCIQLQDV